MDRLLSLLIDRSCVIEG